MKKTFNILLVGFSLLTDISCVTHPSQDIEMLQKIYPTVYSLHGGFQYITIDSNNHVYHIRVTVDGRINSRIRIK